MVDVTEKVLHDARRAYDPDIRGGARIDLLCQHRLNLVLWAMPRINARYR